MITGVHAIVFSQQPEQVRAFLRDVLELPSVDAGGGWLIFALPPDELAAHPAEESGLYQPRHPIPHAGQACRARR